MTTPFPTTASFPDADRSVPRRRRRAGDLSRDGRGRVLATPAILSYGFRPFFFSGALYAGIAIPVWLCLYFRGYPMPGSFSGLTWHIHEMLFGYLAAVVAGFILTAIPNWTGRLPLSGAPLALLVGLWIIGRLACAMVADPWAAAGLDLLFPLALMASVWREVIAGRNWKNAPIAAMLTLFALGNAAHHAGNIGLLQSDAGVRLTLGVIAMLIALIGGRIVPSFTRNWLVKAGAERLPASMGRLDKIALLTTALAALFWIALPEWPVTGGLLLAAGGLIAARLARWQGQRVMREPILAILHIGYAWLAASLALLGLAVLLPTVVPASAALHALTAGAVGTMTLAVMTRASLGHTGRSIEADGWTVAIYAAVTLGALARVAAPFAAGAYGPILLVGGILWSGAFLGFAVRFGPILWGRRATARA